MVAKRAKGKRAARRPAAARQLVVMVSDFQRQRLIEDAAYFRAEHFRRVEPGRYREQDRSAAEAEIGMVLRGCRITRCS
jgi:hypothetical protein